MLGMSGVGLFLDFDRITLYDIYFFKGKERIQIIKELKMFINIWYCQVICFLIKAGHSASHSLDS